MPTPSPIHSWSVQLGSGVPHWPKEPCELIKDVWAILDILEGAEKTEPLDVKNK